MIINESNLGNYQVPNETLNGICVDIGANVGNFLKQYSSQFEIIHAYEPIKTLSDKIKSYDLKNVTVYNEAVSDKCGFTKIFLHQNNESGSSSIEEAVNNVIQKDKNLWTNELINESPTVDLEKIFERLDNKSIDYLKIDCENSEFLILYEKKLENINYIGIEIHGQMGQKKWTKLKDWVSLTHDGFPNFDNYQHSEVLLKNKKLI